jgi:hypothetical protein
MDTQAGQVVKSTPDQPELAFSVQAPVKTGRSPQLRSVVKGLRQRFQRLPAGPYGVVVAAELNGGNRPG